MRKMAFWWVACLGTLWLTVGSALAQYGVTAVVVNEFANVRIIPALGADVRGTVPAGYRFEIINGRSPDGEWIRVDFNGDEGWVNITPLTILTGDLAALPVADPRTIPYGGFESPRAGLSDASSPLQGTLSQSGLRVRAGPSTGYPVLANAPRFSVVSVLGRTASSSWVQINFEGTLGWVAASFIELPSGVGLATLPIDGVVADSLPISQPIADDYFDTLRLMLARVELAQPSLDSIRAAWTDAALAGRAACQPFPSRPSNYNIPNPLLAAYYDRLNPLITLFNDAMFNVRHAIDLYIEVCRQPGSQNPVGQATTIGALETVALADQQFSDLRRRLGELIPPVMEPGEGECLFVFNLQAEILPVITLNQLVIDSLSPRTRARGYCFDAVEGQSLRLEVLRRPEGTAIPLVAVSPFDNPTNFIGTAQGSVEMPQVRLGPLLIPHTGRYLIVVSSAPVTEGPLEGEYGLVISDSVSTVFTDLLRIDPDTGQFVVTTPIGTSPTAPLDPSLGDPIVIPPLSVDTCPILGATCEQLTSCQQAIACLQAGGFNLDPENNGIPCQQTLCSYLVP